MESWPDISIEILSCLLTLLPCARAETLKTTLNPRLTGIVPRDLLIISPSRGWKKKGGGGWKGEEECNFTYARLDGQGRDFHREVFFMPRTGTICHFVISWKNLKFLRFRFSFYLVLFKFNNRLVCASRILLSKVAAVYCNRLTSFRFNNKAKLELSKDRIVIGEMMIIREESWERKFRCFFLCIMPIRPLIASLVFQIYTRINSFKKWFDKLVVVKIKRDVYIYLFESIFGWLYILVINIFQMSARMNARIINISLLYI